jgi:hypothetical protein
LAEGLWAAHSLGVTSPSARARAVVAHLAGQGVTLEHPYATGGFADYYDESAFPS